MGQKQSYTLRMSGKNDEVPYNINAPNGAGHVTCTATHLQPINSHQQSVNVRGNHEELPPLNSELSAGAAPIVEVLTPTKELEDCLMLGDMNREVQMSSPDTSDLTVILAPDYNKGSNDKNLHSHSTNCFNQTTEFSESKLCFEEDETVLHIFSELDLSESSADNKAAAVGWMFASEAPLPPPVPYPTDKNENIIAKCDPCMSKTEITSTQNAPICDTESECLENEVVALPTETEYSRHELKTTPVSSTFSHANV